MKSALILATYRSRGGGAVSFENEYSWFVFQTRKFESG